ncbi:unnamed protein product [Microthlaspi erraticum]|uniref:Uncharacterized protein n=1 Tax=Microthlaspi erraticum TaxID=1685480 RepID=A0A6D2KRL1_9BRAS|nr:unnamed protein product [Microthlaspi erraticum]
MPCSAGLIYRDRKPFARTHEPGKKAAIGRNFRIGTDRPCRSIRETTIGLGRNLSATKIWPTKSLDRDKIHRPSAQNFLGQGTPMAKTKGNESMKKKKNPFMEPPKKQIKLGSSSSNARAAIPTSPHSIDAIKNMWRVQEEEKMIGHLKLAQDLEGKKLCVRFGRLITAIVLHVGIDIPNYEPLPKPTPLDLHALQHIHFLNRWTKDPTRFCYEFPIGPANTSLVLLPHEDIPSLRSGVVTFQPNEEEFYVPSSEKPSFPMLTYRTLQHAVKTQRRLQERHVLTTGMAAHQALDRVNKLEKIVECQSRFISRLVRVVRHIAPERLFRPSSTAREPYEPDLGEFSLDSELGSEGDDPIDEEESSSHCHT